MKSNPNQSIQLIPVPCRRIALMLSCYIFINGLTFSQTESGKLLKCTWADQSQFNYYKKETVFIRIKNDRDYKPWNKYSYKKLVLEEIENGSLVASLDKNNKVRIPLAAIDSIQLINANRKNKNNLIAMGILTAVIGIFTIFLGGNRFLGDPFDEEGAKGCITLFSGFFISLFGLGMVISGELSHSKYEKLGPEIRLEEPGCHCEWQSKP